MEPLPEAERGSRTESGKHWIELRVAESLRHDLAERLAVVDADRNVDAGGLQAHTGTGEPGDLGQAPGESRSLR